MTLSLLVGAMCVGYLINRYFIFRSDEYAFLLPKDYRGIFLVIEDKEKGITPRKSGGKIIYDIPSDGILYVKYISDSNFYHFECSVPGSGIPTIFDKDHFNVVSFDEYVQGSIVQYNNLPTFWYLFYGPPEDFKRLQEEKKLGSGSLENYIRIKEEYAQELKTRRAEKIHDTTQEDQAINIKIFNNNTTTTESASTANIE